MLSHPGEVGRQADGLRQLNPSPTNEVVRRGQEAMERKRRDFDDWMLIAEALQVGRTEVMGSVHTNQSNGKRYERAMAEWLVRHSFHVVDKATRKRLLECLQNRKEIEAWRASLTEPERFRFNHPDTVLRRWKAKTVVPDPNAPHKPSPVSKWKAEVARLEEENHRMRREIERAGGDLWAPEDAPEDIAIVMLEKLSPTKAERVARAILRKLKGKKTTKTGARPSAGIGEIS
jgi:hypothetical protein